MAEQKFNPCMADIYVDHLVAISEHNEAVAQEDIYNEFGMLLLSKGVQISKKTAGLLSNHKLAKPVDEIIQLARPLKNQTLLLEFNQLFEQNEDFAQIHQKNKAADLLRHLCVVQPFPPTLLQKLTVLKDGFPKAYERTLFGAWFSSLVAQELGWSKEETYNVFVASLFQDLGLLHIPIDVVSMTGGFTPEQWRAMQSHVVVSSIIVENLGCYADTIIRAILEHHERFDGAGYPSAKNAASLGDSGQLIGLSDLLFRIRSRSVEFEQDRSLSAVLTYLKVNKTFSRAPYEAAMTVLKRSKLSALQQFSETDRQVMVDFLITRGKAIKQIYNDTQKIQILLQEIDLQKQGRAIHILIEKAEYVYHAAGFFHEELFNELDTLSHDELEDAVRTQVEFLWVIKRIQQCAPLFIEFELNKTEANFQTITDLLSEISLHLNRLNLETFSC